MDLATVESAIAKPNKRSLRRGFRWARVERRFPLTYAAWQTSLFVYGINDREQVSSQSNIDFRAACHSRLKVDRTLSLLSRELATAAMELSNGPG